MTTLTIHIPDEKADLIKRLLEELDVKIEKSADTHTYCESDHTPNTETIKAIEELRAGKGKRFKNAEELFAAIK